MYLTGMVDKRTLEKYEREAKEKNRETWYLSWCMDTNLEGMFMLFEIILIVVIINGPLKTTLYMSLSIFILL